VPLSFKKAETTAIPFKNSSPEFSQSLKKVEEEQEAGKEDVSEEEADNKEGTTKTSHRIS
jgi:hypothetical protein